MDKILFFAILFAVCLFVLTQRIVTELDAMLMMSYAVGLITVPAFIYIFWREIEHGSFN